jgi:hypothetical protein
VGADGLPVAVEAAAGVAHGVGVLAHDERSVGPGPGGPGHEVLHRRVHRRDHVGLGTWPSQDGGEVGGDPGQHVLGDAALVVHRPGRVPGPQPRCRREVDGRHAGLVAERPHDDGGVVLVPLRHPHDPLEHGGRPPRVLGEAPQVGVRLDVGLVDHVHAEAVAHVVEVVVVRVVRRAHGVQVVLLHQHDVRLDRRRRDRLPPPGVVVVAVDALDQDGPPVDEQLVAPDLHATEADPQRHDVDHGAVGVEEGDGEVVEGRHLRGPRGDLRHRQLDRRAPPLERHPAHEVVGGVLEADGGVGRHPGHLHDRPPPLRPVARGTDDHLRPEVAVPRARVPVGHGVDVADVHRWRGDERDAAVQPGVVPVVLVLEVGGIRPAHHRQREVEGRPRLDEVGEVERRREAGVLAHADRHAVHVHVEHRLGTADVQHDPPATPARGNRHRPPVHGRRVVRGHVRWGAGERHLDVRVLRAGRSPAWSTSRAPRPPPTPATGPARSAAVTSSGRGPQQERPTTRRGAAPSSRGNVVDIGSRP